MEIAERIRKGDRLALARLLTWIENDLPEGQAVLDQLFSHTGQSHIIGITGPSGSGKSTLVNRLALKLAKPAEKAKPLSVAILAVDPSSPFSGGALLGDRVRMRDLMEHSEIFIRSVATRGALGGLARSASELVLGLEAAGIDIILVETVGAGQSEVDIARLAHTTLVVEAPGLGDDIQAAKAGILEIADILVVNKADKSGAVTTARSLAAMLEIGLESASRAKTTAGPTWSVPVLKTSALNNEGIGELADTIRMHCAFLHESGAWEERNQARLMDLFNRLLRERLFSDWLNALPEESLADVIQKIQTRKLSPHQALNQLFP
jgi:LAO/AO transport system kinase